jgi:hypothetical protein
LAEKKVEKFVGKGEFGRIRPARNYTCSIRLGRFYHSETAFIGIATIAAL